MPNYLQLNAAFTWPNGSRSVYDSGSNRTFFGFADGSNAGLWVGQVDHATSTRTAFKVSATLGGDDHNAPTVLVLASGKVLCAWTDHPGNNVLTRTSSSATSIATWAATVTIAQDADVATNEYHTLCQLSSDSNRIYLFYIRSDGSTRRLRYHTSTDDGATWTAYTEVTIADWGVAGNPQPYFYISSNRTDRIDFAVRPCVSTASTQMKLYHFYAQFTGGSLKWFTSAAADITASLPLGPANVTLVFDPGASKPASVDEVYYDGSNVYIAFAAFPLGDGTDIRYRLAKWNGSSWTNTTVDVALGGDTIGDQSIASDGSHPFYYGGMTINRADPTKMIVSKKVSGIHEIQEYTTSDGGSTWAKTTDITLASAVKNCRPTWVQGATQPPPTNLLYFKGTYVTFNSFSVDTYAYPSLTPLVIGKDTVQQGSSGTNVSSTSYFPEVGQKWAYTTGSAVKVDASNNLYTDGAAVAALYVQGVAISPDVSVSMDLVCKTVVNSDRHGVCARMTGGVTATYYHVRYNVNSGTPGNSALELYRVITGTATQLGSSQTMTALGLTALSAGQTANLRLDVLGSGATVTLNVYWNNVLVYTQADSNAARIVTAGFQGIRASLSTVSGATTGMHFTNFLASDLITSGVFPYFSDSELAGGMREMAG